MSTRVEDLDYHKLKDLYNSLMCKQNLGFVRVYRDLNFSEVLLFKYLNDKFNLDINYTYFTKDITNITWNDYKLKNSLSNISFNDIKESFVLFYKQTDEKYRKNTDRILTVICIILICIIIYNIIISLK